MTSAVMLYRDSPENSADADISQNTESHTAEMFLASVGLQPRYVTFNIMLPWVYLQI